MNPAEQRHNSAHVEAQKAARLRAVQALFQMDLGGMGARRVIEEFRRRRLPGNDDTGAEAKADAALFAKLVLGVVNEQSALDRAISAHLAAGWRLERLDTTVRALLRAAVWEILYAPKTPLKAVLDAYVSLSGDFFDGPEPGFVNGVLEAIGKEGREGELAPQ